VVLCHLLLSGRAGRNDFCFVQDGVLESRVGLLYIPLRPIYGFGGVACALLFHRFIKEPLLIFLLGMLICSVIEYVGSFVMEKVFGTVTWDYSDKLLNLHGRICLQYSCYWGSSRCWCYTCSTDTCTVLWICPKARSGK